MGVVYKARHDRLDCDVAIKFPRLAGPIDRDSAARFLREAKLIGRLKHPNIVRALDAVESAYGPYLVTEYIDGETIEALVRRDGPLPLGRAVALVVQAGQALAYAHAQGIVHRDVKPSNLLLDKSDVLRVVDFGLAKLQVGDLPRDGSARGGDATVCGAFLGTVGYAAPDQLRSDEPVDHRADIYALGCVLSFMLSGAPPHMGSLSDRLIAQIAEQRTALPLPLGDYPAGFEQVWRRLVAFDPARRFRHVRGGASVEGLSLSARTGSRLQRYWRDVRLRLDAALAFVAAAVGRWRQADRDARPVPALRAPSRSSPVRRRPGAAGSERVGRTSWDARATDQLQWHAASFDSPGRVRDGLVRRGRSAVARSGQLAHMEGRSHRRQQLPRHRVVSQTHVFQAD
jgi:hypothetical protein